MGRRRGGVKPTTHSQKVLTSQKVVAKKPAGIHVYKREETIAIEQGDKVDVAILDKPAARKAAIKRCTTAVANCDDVKTQTKWAAIKNAPPGKRKNQALGFG